MLYKKILLMLLMFGVSLLAIYLKPTHKIAEDRQAFLLDKAIPLQFGEWKVYESTTRSIVNPEQEATMKRIYNQILSRSYINSKNEIVMVVIAYGEDQSDANALHYPEVCYPAQGFNILNTRLDSTVTKKGEIKVKRLLAFIPGRMEPITYWTTIGNSVVRGKFETKFQRIKYGLNGSIPDGLIFRVSTISSDQIEAEKVQDGFLSDLIDHINPKYLKAITGL